MYMTYKTKSIERIMREAIQEINEAQMRKKVEGIPRTTNLYHEAQ